MGRTQTRSHRSDFEGAPCLCFSHPAGPAGQKRHSHPREGPRGGKGLVEEFAPDCAERTISAGTSRRFGSRFRGFRRSVSIGGEPVASSLASFDRRSGGPGLVEGSLSECLIPRGGWEGVCHGCFILVFSKLFCHSILVRFTDFCSNSFC